MIINPEKKPLFENTYKKFLYISDLIGDVLYGHKKIKKEDVINRLFKPKPVKKQPVKKEPQESIIKKLSLIISNEKLIKRLTGAIILSVIALMVLVIIYQLINYIITILLDIMEWWILALIIIVFVTPIMIMIAFKIAKDYE
jgi:hypothetical protein